MNESAHEVNVLYLGMAWDIFGALLLVPNLTTLFAIDLGEIGSWIGTKRIIRTILQEGTIYPDKIWDYTQIDFPTKNIILHTNLINREFTGECTTPGTWSSTRSNSFKEDPDTCYKLPEPAVLVSDEDDTKTKVWKLTFNYLGKQRELVYFYDRNFYKTWPEEIKNISHVIWAGTYDYSYLLSKEGHNEYYYDSSLVPDVLHTMLETRTTPDAKYYEYTMNKKEDYNAYMPHPEGKHTNIGTKKFNFTSENWKRKWWEGEGGKRTKKAKRTSSKKRRAKKTRRN